MSKKRKRVYNPIRDEETFCYDCDSIVGECYCFLEDKWGCEHISTQEEFDDYRRQEKEEADLVDLFSAHYHSHGYFASEEEEDSGFEDFAVRSRVSPASAFKPVSRKPFKPVRRKPRYKSEFENTRVKYFAFGSNMEAGQMLRRCPSAEIIEGSRALDGYSLTFCGHSNKWGGGVATIVSSGEGVVFGRLYSLTWGDVRRLDGFEGHPYVYKRQYVRLTDGSMALTYIKPVNNNIKPPSHSYFTTIARGYQQVGIDLDKLIDASII